MFDALERGELKAVWIVGTNRAASMPNLPRVRAALEAAELVIVQDAADPISRQPALKACAVAVRPRRFSSPATPDAASAPVPVA